MFEALYRFASDTQPLLLAIVFAGYSALAWHMCRSGKPRRLLLLASAPVLFGYVMYRVHCAQGLTCDVGGTNPWFAMGTPYYFVRLIPVFVFASLLAFASIHLLVNSLQRSVRTSGFALAVGGGLTTGMLVFPVAAALAFTLVRY